MNSTSFDILIVDDQVGVRRLLFEALADEGYIVKMAGSGAEALQVLSQTLPSLVLLDIKMSGMTGIETLQEIRKHYAQLPVAMMTAYGDMEIMDQTKSLGVQHYLNKPFDLDDVRVLVRSILSRSEGYGKLQADIG
ncbi:response regulator receiver protein [Desulforamulus reducens MI-1]|uniref:Stage 0 sporulation protein A homolog n=1 Tax=Desulforamulus reducens (strain ATCC BAA-1160 / DSM 100696 / MI-1) TaxID=349161 RepID=A4J9C7_DESRM|nr:response regulator [Desulforamulus reducens]ABO51680.1 response regulator receiver protein [Desulforamulus reducens MI-1]